MNIFYILTALIDFYFGGYGLWFAWVSLIQHHQKFTGSSALFIFLCLIPISAGALYLVLVFKKKNMFGTLSIIMNMIGIIATWYLLYIGKNSGPGGIGIAFLVLLILPTCALISLIFLVVALIKAMKTSDQIMPSPQNSFGYKDSINR